MLKQEKPKETDTICNLEYLSEMMNGKTKLITEIIDAFLAQLPDELRSINEAALRTDYVTIKNYAHTMKSSVSIVGITCLTPILTEMENLGASGAGIEKIRELEISLIAICSKAIGEIEKEKHKFI